MGYLTAIGLTVVIYLVGYVLFFLGYFYLISVSYTHQMCIRDRSMNCLVLDPKTVIVEASEVYQQEAQSHRTADDPQKQGTDPVECGEVDVESPVQMCIRDSIPPGR